MDAGRDDSGPVRRDPHGMNPLPTGPIVGQTAVAPTELQLPFLAERLTPWRDRRRHPGGRAALAGGRDLEGLHER
jgi:hypothetical protein